MCQSCGCCVEIYFSGSNHYISAGIVVRTTKINFNIKEAKDPMDHGSSPAVVVKSNVIILWVIIHQWAGVLRPLLLGQCWGTQSNTGVKGVSGLSFLYVDGAINIMFEPDIPLETNEKGWLLLSKLCVNCEWYPKWPPGPIESLLDH